MAKVAITVFAAALATLTACATDEQPLPQAPVTSSTGIPITNSTGTAVTSAANASVPAPGYYRPGYGVVESVALVRPGPVPSASAGGTVAPPPYRVTVRMDDGTVQIIDQDNRSFLVGDRVQFTNDGRILRI
jgi:hypothetical protein